MFLGEKLWRKLSCDAIRLTRSTKIPSDVGISAPEFVAMFCISWALTLLMQYLFFDHN
jgi:hypothetical protein